MDAFFVACVSIAKCGGFSEYRDIRGRLSNDIEVDRSCCDGDCGGDMMERGGEEEKEERQEAMEW